MAGLEAPGAALRRGSNWTKLASLRRSPVQLGNAALRPLMTTQVLSDMLCVDTEHFQEASHDFATRILLGNAGIESVKEIRKSSMLKDVNPAAHHCHLVLLHEL